MALAQEELADLAEVVIAGATALGATIAIAESLTGGLVAATLIAVPGASAVVRLGVTAYDTRMKSHVLGVESEVLAARGPVDPDVACQMAAGVRTLAAVSGMPAAIGLSTTGVAGPELQDGNPVGLVYIGCATSDGSWATESMFSGSRADIQMAAVAAALQACATILRESTGNALGLQE